MRLSILSILQNGVLQVMSQHHQLIIWQSEPPSHSLRQSQQLETSLGKLPQSREIMIYH